MNKEQKKQLLRQWREANKPQYELSREEAGEMFIYIFEQIEAHGCNETLRFTHVWLEENISSDRHEQIYVEMEKMGGFCDCEVLCNCYEEYDIDPGDTEE